MRSSCRGTGQSLVKGIITTLSAIGLSVKPVGSIYGISVKGIAPIELNGVINKLVIEGGVNPAGGI